MDTANLTSDSYISEQSKSLWMDIQLSPFPSLKHNLTADVCIVGAGITGLTCAYTLLMQGKTVIVLDQGTIGDGQTARTTAHLTWALDDRYFELEKLFGQKGARLAAESHLMAIDYIETIIRDEKIDCDFERVDGYLFGSQEILDKEFHFLQKIGMETNKITRAPFSSIFETGPCIHFPRQAQFHILKYLQGLIQAIVKLGGKIYSNTHVSDFEDGSKCFVKTSNGATITSQSVIVATCTPVNNRFFIHTKQAAYRTYVIATPIPKNSVRQGLYWDTEDPYHYIRTQKHVNDPTLDYLIIGGEDHKTGQDGSIGEKYNHLEDWARLRFPMIKTIDFRWSGQVFEPIDSLAFIGKNPGDKHIYIATGDSGNGLTHGTIAGILLPDLILKKNNPWNQLYDPSRKTLPAISEYINENLNSIVQLKDWLTPGDMKTVETLTSDTGIILRNGLKKFAIYKDKQNNIHIHSALCPHLGGCLRWNQDEKSWDCPLHGSRFDGLGCILNGPAINELSCEKNQF